MNWKSIKVEGYSVSEDGQVKNDLTGRILKPFKNNKGYYLISLKGKHYLVHRLVAEAFLDKPDGCDIVEHKDDNPSNNSVSNLMWSTQRDNLKRPGRINKMTDYYKSEEWKEHYAKALATRRANGFKMHKSEKQKLKEAARLERIAKEREKVRPSLEQQYSKNIDTLIELIKSGYTLQKAAIQLGINKSTGITYFSKRYYDETGIKLTSYKVRKPKKLSKKESKAEKLSNKIKELYDNGKSIEDICDIIKNICLA